MDVLIKQYAGADIAMRKRNLYILFICFGAIFYELLKSYLGNSIQLAALYVLYFIVCSLSVSRYGKEV